MELQRSCRATLASRGGCLFQLRSVAWHSVAFGSSPGASFAVIMYKWQLTPTKGLSNQSPSRPAFPVALRIPGPTCISIYLVGRMELRVQSSTWAQQRLLQFERNAIQKGKEKERKRKEKTTSAGELQSLTLGAVPSCLSWGSCPAATANPGDKSAPIDPPLTSFIGSSAAIAPRGS